MTKKPSLNTAYHEAGHAVASMWVRPPRRFRVVSIVPDSEKGSAGHTRYPPPSRSLRETIESGYLTAHAERFLENEAVILVAGEAAVAIRNGKKNWSRGAVATEPHPKYGKVIVAGDHHDLIDILLRRTGGDGDEATLLGPVIRHRARRLVQAHWDEVEALAQALMERRRLTWDEALEIRRNVVLGRRAPTRSSADWSTHSPNVGEQ